MCPFKPASGYKTTKKQRFFHTVTGLHFSVNVLFCKRALSKGLSVRCKRANGIGQTSRPPVSFEYTVIGKGITVSWKNLFRAGVGVADITPPIGLAIEGGFTVVRGEKVLDPLFVSVVAPFGRLSDSAADLHRSVHRLQCVLPGDGPAAGGNPSSPCLQPDYRLHPHPRPPSWALLFLKAFL